jgi:hypothetical protein
MYSPQEIPGQVCCDFSPCMIWPRMYEALFRKDHLDLDDIPYALDEAVESLIKAVVPAARWAFFMHMGS